MSDAVKVLKPLGRDNGLRRAGDAQGSGQPNLGVLRAAAALIAVAAIAVLMLHTARPAGFVPTDRNAAVDDPPQLALSAIAGSATDSDDPVAVFERFASLVNRGDSAAVEGLLATRLPDITGVGTAEWPQLPTDARLWDGGQLESSKVAGFVRYMFTVPGSVLVSDCTSGGSPTLAIVTCSYVASGGVLAALGQRPEEGHIHGILIDGEVAGMLRRGAVDVRLWHRFAEWVDESAADPSGDLLASGELDPVYSGDSALVHVSLAMKMAASLSEDPAVYRMYGPPFTRAGGSR